MEDRRLFEEAEEERRTSESRLRALKEAASALALNVVLSLAIVASAVIGGVIFQALESNNELEICYHTAQHYQKLEADQAKR